MSEQETQAAADAERTRRLEARGLRVVRFTNDQVMADTDAVLERILAAATPLPPSPSRREGASRRKSSRHAGSP